MGHLTLFERIRVIKLYNNLEVGCKYKYKVISALAKSNYGIEISDKGAYGIVKKWQSTQRLADRQIKMNSLFKLETLILLEDLS